MQFVDLAVERFDEQPHQAQDLLHGATPVLAREGKQGERLDAAAHSGELVIAAGDPPQPEEEILKEEMRDFRVRYTGIGALTFSHREGKHDDIPEQAFYLKGGIEDVLAAAEKMKAAA